MAVRPLVAAVEGVAVVAVEEELCLPTAATTTTAAAGHAVLQHTDDWRGRHVLFPVWWAHVLRCSHPARGRGHTPGLHQEADVSHCLYSVYNVLKSLAMMIVLYVCMYVCMCSLCAASTTSVIKIFRKISSYEDRCVCVCVHAVIY